MGIDIMKISNTEVRITNNNSSFVFDFEVTVTDLFIRKFQLASMINGSIVTNITELENSLEKLHELHNYSLGLIANEFALFSKREGTIQSLSIETLEILSTIRPYCSNQSANDFLIDNYETNSFLLEKIRKHFKRCSSLEMHKIYTFSDLILLTETELLAIRDLGPKRVTELKLLLEEHGLHLRIE